jgi:hypothetical protein
MASLLGQIAKPAALIGALAFASLMQRDFDAVYLALHGHGSCTSAWPCLP